MMRRTKIVIAAGVTVVALGTGTGVAAAATSGSAAGTPAASASTGASGADKGHARKQGENGKKKGDARKHRGLLGRVQHGQLTLGGKKDRTVEVQRGEVTAASGSSVTLKSRDGYTHTYTFGKDSKVRQDKKQVSADEVAEGYRAMVVADHDGSTVLRLRVHQAR